MCQAVLGIWDTLASKSEKDPCLVQHLFQHMVFLLILPYPAHPSGAPSGTSAADLTNLGVRGGETTLG